MRHFMIFRALHGEHVVQQMCHLFIDALRRMKLRVRVGASGNAFLLSIGHPPILLLNISHDP